MRPVIVAVGGVLLAFGFFALVGEATAASVNIPGFSFSPSTVVINVGDSVTWTNSHSTGHTATASGFNTGTIAPGSSATITFNQAGTFNYACAFPHGMSGTVVVNAPTPPPNVAPTASFTASVAGLTVSVDASGSSDPEGATLTYAWDFGDAAIATGSTSSHAYASAGTYPITLTVSDGSLTGSTTKSVTVARPNAAPTAAFTVSVSGLSVSVDGSGSSDPDGDPLAFSWQFGDGATGSGATASHAFAAGSTYAITLTVSDGSLTGTSTQSVSVARPNHAPTAAFSVVATRLNVTVDAANSTDPDGDALSFSWEWGDGSPLATGRSASHAFASPGAYTIRLSISDGSATATATRVVNATLPNRAPTIALVREPPGPDGDANGSLLWSGTMSDPDGDALQFRVRHVATGRVDDIPSNASGAWDYWIKNGAAHDATLDLEFLAWDGELESEPLKVAFFATAHGPPEVAVLSPAQGATVPAAPLLVAGTWDGDREDFAMEAIADGTTLVAVEVDVNGTWRATWDLTGAAPGEHELEISAFVEDAAMSAPLRVVVPAPPPVADDVPDAPASRADPPAVAPAAEDVGMEGAPVPLGGLLAPLAVAIAATLAGAAASARRARRPRA